jgi:hypothetical protein
VPSFPPSAPKIDYSDPLSNQSAQLYIGRIWRPTILRSQGRSSCFKAPNVTYPFLAAIPSFRENPIHTPFNLGPPSSDSRRHNIPHIPYPLIPTLPKQALTLLCHRILGGGESGIDGVNARTPISLKTLLIECKPEMQLCRVGRGPLSISTSGWGGASVCSITYIMDGL